ncbi:MAG: tRNA lysidine(34) synthetase TilS [Campylobacterota bacterium]|nr:tRNA lysidine(34) synthetase TilS [Campylobacterota bacterium]
MIHLKIKTTKNIMGFSAGIDSTALFFLLLEENIPFDIVIVDYNQRAQSKDEVIYATQLAHKYNKKCYISTYPDSLKFTEKEARDFRYNFFDQVIKENNYEALLTAHQLNDMLEWFLMQFTKGAGLSELIGMEELSYRNDYILLKPLLKYSKEQLKDYLDSKNIKYFIDQSNYDEKYKRNYFRHNFSDKLLSSYKNGISKSFDFLEKDKNSLFKENEKLIIENLSIYKYIADVNVAIRIIDKDLKKRGVMISYATREEIIEKKELVISHKIAVSLTDDKIYIAPFIQNSMDKKFKDRCRINKLPKNIRSYLSSLSTDKFNKIITF